MHINIPIFSKESTSIDGITLCFVIITWTKNPSHRFLMHELAHVVQWKKQPFTFHIRYFAEMFANKRKGMTWWESYRSISYEVEARNEEMKKRSNT